MCEKNLLNKWSRYCKSCYHKHAQKVIVTGPFLLTIMIFWLTAKWDLLPATFCTIITLHFSYYAYKFSKERFRLDLFDKRWEVYEKVLEFCSTVTSEGGLVANERNKEDISNAIKAAHNSFRGVGWHKTQALFGNDIHQHFDKLNESYAWLVSHKNPPRDETKRDKWAEDDYSHTMFIWQTVNKMPELFKPYVHFGNYKA